jgi:hypothetical protein
MTTVSWTPPATILNWHTALMHALPDVVVESAAQYGPCGERLVIASTTDSGSVIVTQADHDGVEFLHASIAWADRDPSYAELAGLHRAVFGRRRWSYQMFAPESDHVNIHAHALHLWGRVDGKPWMPNIAAGWRSV